MYVRVRMYSMYIHVCLAQYLCLTMQRTATMATVELCPGSILGVGFTLLVGLSEIHVPRMWVEEDSTGHHVRLLNGAAHFCIKLDCFVYLYSV